MKKLLLTILFCLIPCVLFSGGGFTAIMGGGGAGGAAAASCSGTNPSDCVARETFDGAQSCIAADDPDATNCSLCASGDCWTAAVAGTVDFASTTHSLSGNSMSLTGAAASYRNTTNFTAVDTAYAAAYVYVETAKSGFILTIKNTSAGTLCTLYMDASGNVIVQNAGGTDTATIAQIASGNGRYLKLKYVKDLDGGSASAICQGWVSADGTTWTTTQTSTDGTSTTQAGRLYLGAGSSSLYHFDDIRWHTGDITW